MGEATTTPKMDYFRLRRPLWRKLKKCLPKKKTKSSRGGGPRASDRALVNAIWYVPCGRDVSGRPSIAIGLGFAQA
jgi:hypothetical protein